MIKGAILFIFLLITSINAKDIYVKYNGNVNVDNGNFEHFNLSYSSLIKDMYYDNKNKYLIVQLKSTYYNYCGIGKNTVDNWLSSGSLGGYYLGNIKGNYDCRVYPKPNY